MNDNSTCFTFNFLKILSPVSQFIRECWYKFHDKDHGYQYIMESASIQNKSIER